MYDVWNNKPKGFWLQRLGSLVILLAVVLLLFGEAAWAGTQKSTNYYKMLSAIEYTGKGQFRNETQALFAVQREPLFGDTVRYVVSSKDLAQTTEGSTPAGPSGIGQVSFVVDNRTGHLSSSSRDIALLEQVNNRCVTSLRKITEADIGKTWKQSFDLSSLTGPVPESLKFTVSAIQPETQLYGKMMMVRALSEPFKIEAAGKDGTKGEVKGSISAAYMFDEEMDQIYMSVSVFEASTKTNGFKEQLRHEVATYKTDSEGLSVDMTGLDKNFERFIRKLGLRKDAVKIEKEVQLPRWSRSEVLAAAQAANICSALACEGALNPVATVCVPVARTIGMQSMGQLAAAGQIGTISGALAQSVPGVATLKIAVAPAAFMGMSATTAGVVAGGTVGTVAVASGGSGGSSSRSAQ